MGNTIIKLKDCENPKSDGGVEMLMINFMLNPFRTP